MSILEKMFTKEKIKSHLVDTLAAYVFFQPIRIASELYAGDLEMNEFARARLIGLGVSLTIAAPLTKLADKWEEKVWKITDENQRLRRAGAALTYAIPISAITYSGILATSGAEADEIMRTVPTNIALTIPIAAVAYRKYLDWVRKKFGTTPDYLTNQQL